MSAVRALTRRFMRDALLRGLAFPLLARLTVEGRGNIPTRGPLMLYMNHTHAFDPAVVIGAAWPRFAVPMSKAESFRTPLWGLLLRAWGAYPVRRGMADRAAVQRTLALLRAGEMVLIAPEGTRSPALIAARPGFAYAAAHSGAALLPVAVVGTGDVLPSLRQARRAAVSVRFGRAFRFKGLHSDRDRRERLRQMTDDAMYRLAALLPEARRGVYGDLSAATGETICEDVP